MDPMPKPAAIICDIDGTIADMGKGVPGRRGNHPLGAFMWDRVGEDTPIQPIIDLIHVFQWDCHILYVSGRDEICRDVTTGWIAYHTGSFASTDRLFMRPHKDNRPDEILKAEIYHRDIEPHYNIRWVLDDRNKVVTMWRNVGLTVLQVADGPF